MINAFIRQINDNKDPDIRASLLWLKNGLKECNDILGSFSKKDIIQCAEILAGLLNSEDPKIRKNAALTLGMLGLNDYTEALFEAYKCEQTKYNKASYIEALSRLDFSLIRKELESFRDNIRSSDIPEEDKKHVIEEMRSLNGMLDDNDSHRHAFTGFDLVNEMALLTNRNFKDITIKELGKLPHKEFTAGVMVKTKHLKKVLESRTFSEILFVPESAKIVDFDPQTAAKSIIDGGLLEYLKARHSEPEKPFYFRVELKIKDEKKIADLAKKFAGELEFASKWALINSTGNYDIELRFIENSEGKLNFLIGMKTLEDDRFSYRKRVIAAGMKPSLAALLVRLTSAYVKENAAVLDPVCGSGIFLIEREKFKPARLLYGVDIFKEAIDASKENISAAGLSKKTELINRDILKFEHKYRFDEIYADMPRETGGKDRHTIEVLYRDFMKKIKKLLEDDGILCVYTHNRDFLWKYALKEDYMIAAEYEISRKEEAYYYILRSMS